MAALQKRVVQRAVLGIWSPDFERRGERLRWAQTGNVRAYYQYDDLSNVARVRHNVVGDANGQFPEIDDNAPSQPADCGEVPEDVGSDET